MEAVIAVAEELSFSRAGGRLHLSQPAITKQIAELEESLGVVLFVRDHHVVSITDAGRAYIEEARIPTTVTWASFLVCLFAATTSRRAATTLRAR
jgi:DNA-binding MarR family transcriptional regulator